MARYYSTLEPNDPLEAAQRCGITEEKYVGKMISKK
jgi:hypothetical protein